MKRLAKGIRSLFLRKLDVFENRCGGLLWISFLQLLTTSLHCEELDADQTNTNTTEDASNVKRFVILVLLEDDQADSDPGKHDESLVRRDDFQLVVQFDGLV